MHRHRRRGLRAKSIFMVACTAAGMVVDAKAADTWDNSSGDALWSGALNWVDNTVPTSADSVTFPTGFPNADTTITLPTGAQALSLIINDSYTLTGGSLTLGATGSISVTTNESAAISTTLAGTNGLTKSGLGTLVLGGTNSFTGSVFANAGILSIDSNARLGNTANGLIIDGGTLATTANFSSARNFTMGAGGGAIAVNSGTSFGITSALVANANSLNCNGSGTLVLSAAAGARTGSTSIQLGTLRVTNGSALGTGSITTILAGRLELGGVSVFQPMTLNLNGGIIGTGNSTYAGTISAVSSPVVLGTGTSATDTLTIGNAANDFTSGASSNTIVSGSGTVLLPFSNDYAGSWQINTGALRIQNATALGTGTSAVVVNNGGALEIGGVTLDRAITLANGSTLRGTGTAASNGVATISSGAATTLSTGASSSDVITVGNAANDLTGGGGGSTITVVGSGKVVLPQASNYVGNWTANSTVEVQNATALGSSANSVTINSGALLQIDGVTIANPITLNTGPTIKGTGTAESDGVHTVSGGASVTLSTGASSSDALTVGAGINALTGGSGSNVHVTGSGTVTLPFANNYVGGWQLDGGTLHAVDALSLGNGSSAIVVNAATLQLGPMALDRAMTLNNGAQILTSGTSSLTGTLSVASGATVIVDAVGASDVLTLGNAISDITGGAGATISVFDGGIGGTVILPFGNNYTGGWSVEHQILRIQDASALGTGTSPVELFKGQIDVDGVFLPRNVTLDKLATLRGLGNATMSGTATVIAGESVGLQTGSAADVFTIGNGANDLTGGGSGTTITVSGAGKVVLAQSSDFTGSWVLANGTLEAGADDRLGNSANTISLSGGTLSASASFATARSLIFSGSGGINVPAGVSFDISNASGAGSLTKTGSGTLNFSAASSRTGDTFINGGIALIANNTALGTGGVSITGGLLKIPASTFTNNVTLGAGGTLSCSGTATTTGTLSIGAGAAANLSSSSNVLLVVGDSVNDLTGGGGGASINLNLLGTVQLPQPSDVVANWTLSSGTLQLSADDRLGNAANTVSLAGGIFSTTGSFTSARTFSAGGTISTATGTSLTLTTAMSTATGSLTKTGLGTLVLAGPGSARSGANIINAGTVRLTASPQSGLGNGTITVNSGATLEYANIANTQPSIILNDNSTLAGTGNAFYSHAGDPQIANGTSLSPVNVFFSAPLSSDKLSLGAAVRNDVVASSFATIHVNGAGAIVLQSGGTSASDIFGGAWSQTAGILQVANSSGSGINALGFKNTDAKQANSITVTGGTLAVGGLGSGAGTPQWLRANVTLGGGNIASTNAVDAQYGGDLTTIASTTSKVLLFDPFNPSTPRSVSLVAGAAGTDNNAATTHWAGNLVVDPGNNFTGAFNITRTGGTILVDPGASIQINSGGRVNLGGAADALTDGVDHVNITGQAGSFFNVTSGAKNIGNLDGIPITTVNAGCSLTAKHLNADVLTVADTGKATVRVNGGNTGVSYMNALSLNSTGTLDLNDNDLVVNIATFGQIQNYVFQGYRTTPDPTATGITSTTGQTAAGNPILALFDNALVNSSDFPFGSGQTIGAGAIVGKYTYLGDTDMNGMVTPDDYGAIDSNLGATGLDPGIAWFDGDTDFNYNVTPDDYGAVDANLGLGIGNPLVATGSAAVPEPAAAIFFSVAATLNLRRRRSAWRFS